MLLSWKIKSAFAAAALVALAAGGARLSDGLGGLGFFW